MLERELVEKNEWRGYSSFHDGHITWDRALLNTIVTLNIITST